MRGKKGGIGDYMIESIPNIFYVAIVLMMIPILVTIFVNNDVNTQEVQAEVMFNRLVYSPDIFWKQDALNNTVPGVVVMERFEDDVIEEGISYDERGYGAAELSLKNRNGVIEKVAYLHEENYDRWEPTAAAEVEGAPKMYMKTIPVTYLEGEESSQGTLQFKIIIPES